MNDFLIIALVGIVMASIVVPLSTIAMLKVVPRDGDSS